MDIKEAVEELKRIHADGESIYRMAKDLDVGWATLDNWVKDRYMPYRVLHGRIFEYIEKRGK